MNPRRAIELVSDREERTIALGERLARMLKPGDVVALHGELGAGKTRFVRGLARGLGIDPSRVHSPTFVLVNMYGAATGPALVHVDAYRLRGGEELAPLGWDRLLDGSNIVVVEWAERIERELPKPASRFDVTIEHAGEDIRRIRIESPAGRPELVLSEETAAKCRTCGGAIRKGAATAPFCSERCRLADLGKWFSGQHRISRPAEQEDEEMRGQKDEGMRG
jgi:tRNA threonylcarbamoyladenosine biosynthesis protein TsaE